MVVEKDFLWPIVGVFARFFADRLNTSGTTLDKGEPSKTIMIGKDRVRESNSACVRQLIANAEIANMQLTIPGQKSPPLASLEAVNLAAVE